MARPVRTRSTRRAVKSKSPKTRRTSTAESKRRQERKLAERTLLKRAHLGDREAFRSLYERHRPAVFRAVSAFAELDPGEVDDVLQESFVRAFRHLGRLRTPERFGPWLLAIARNRALSQLARRQAHRSALDEVAREREADLEIEPWPAFDPAELQVVRNLIEQMRDGREKETVRLFYLEGELTARQIAERMGVGKSAVTMRLERFRARVKKKLLARIAAVREGANPGPKKGSG